MILQDCPLNVAFLHNKAAFDSADRRALWKAPRSRGIPDFLLDLIAAVDENTGVRVRLRQKFSDRLQMTSGVRNQPSSASPSIGSYGTCR